MESVESNRESLLLLTLGEISDLIAHSHDLHETLCNIVNHIRDRFRTDVCSVYTFDRATDELVLSATVGLRNDSVDRVRMGLHEGLTGLVAERKEPVNVDDASRHPRYRFFPESGEEEFHSFLGVPLIQGGGLQGVIVVQHRDAREYSANEVRILVAVAAQLAILVANARLTRDLSDAVGRLNSPDASANHIVRSARLLGTSASAGCAHGYARRFEAFDISDPRLVSRPAGDVESEQARLFAAFEAGRNEIDLAARHLAELLGDQFGALMQAQRLMLEDSSLQRDLLRQIEAGDSVERAVVTLGRQYLRAFRKLDHPFFYERIYDIKDVFRRLLHQAAPTSDPVGSDSSIIVVGHEVSLLELFSCDLHRVRGIIVERGGAYSHVAILARSLGIPMITHAHKLHAAVTDGDEVFIDAGSGVAYVNPDASRREICLKLLENHVDERSEPDDAPLDLPIRLEATVNLLPEVARTVRNRAEAVGLYRSEFLELANRSFPTEEEQLEVYRKMLSLLEGRPLTVRTLDLRAEKLVGIAEGVYDADLPWDWRLVDRLPHVQELIRTQLRATLRAATAGPMRILFPMITSQRQLTCALRLLEEASDSLRREGLDAGPAPPIGMMIETPGAALSVRRWAAQVDFVCIGSNDLLHSFLGIERLDDSLESLKDPLDPTFLRTIRHILRAAHAAGRSVTVCGDAASRPRAALALFALEADALSVPPDDLPRLRRAFREARLPVDLAGLRRAILSAKEVEEVHGLLTPCLGAEWVDRE